MAGLFNVVVGPFQVGNDVVDLYAFLVPLCPQRTRIPVFPQPLQKDQNPYYPCMAYLPTFG